MTCDEMAWSPRATAMYLLSVAASALTSVVVMVERSRPLTVAANEEATIATLKHIASLQARLQTTGSRDADGNGDGEHGFLAELGPLSPQQPELGQVTAGVATLHGYRFQLLLPGRDGNWVAEAHDGGPPAQPIDTGAAEQQWICYAWPVAPGRTGNRTFLVTWLGDVIATEASEQVDAEPPLPGRSGLELRDGHWQPVVQTPDVRGRVWTVRG